MCEKNGAKEYYINNKEHIKDKKKSLTEDKKHKIEGYQKEYQKNIEKT